MKTIFAVFRRTVKKFLPVFVLAASGRLANAQAFFTGETGGKDSSSVFIAANASFIRDFTIPGNFWTAYTRGLNDRVDAFGLYGNLTIFGKTQHYWGLGSNIGILKRAGHGIDLAFLSLVSTPLNRRDEASTVFAVFAPIASRPVRLGEYQLTIYGGYLRGEPFGQRANKLFSSPEGTHNGIIGAVVPVTESISVIAEYNPGRIQQNLGLAMIYVFPRK